MDSTYIDFLFHLFHTIYKHTHRWVSFCHVPVFCESLQKYDATLIFGRTFLSSVFLTMRRQLMDRFTAEQDKMLPEKRTLVITHFPKSVNVCVCVCVCVYIYVSILSLYVTAYNVSAYT